MSPIGLRRLGADALAALRYREFRLFFASTIAANHGHWIQEFALGWFVVQLAVRDGDPALGGLYLGLRSIASAVPAVVFGLFAGAFNDRMDRRDLLVWTRVASTMVTIALAAVVITDNANIVVVMVLSALASAAFAFDPPGRWALVPNVVPSSALFSAMGLARASMQVAHTLGPLIGGVLVGPIGVGGVLLAQAALIVGSIGALLPMRPQRVAIGARALGLFGSIGEGARRIIEEDITRWAIVLQLVFALLAQPFIQLLPAVAVETLGIGALELSFLVAATGVGSLLGAFVVAAIGGAERRGLMLMVAMGATGGMLALLGLQRELAGAVLVLFGLGLLHQLFYGTLLVILQVATPDRLRGRVLATQSTIIGGVSPVGVLLIGLLGTSIGISNALVVAGLAVTLVAVLATVGVSAIRELRATDAETTPGTVLTLPASVATE